MLISRASSSFWCFNNSFAFKQSRPCAVLLRFLYRGCGDHHAARNYCRRNFPCSACLLVGTLRAQIARANAQQRSTFTHSFCINDQSSSAAPLRACTSTSSNMASSSCGQHQGQMQDSHSAIQLHANEQIVESTCSSSGKLLCLLKGK